LGRGKTVKNSRLALELHPESGQINTIESIEAGIKLYNKAGVIHWNPDVFVPGVAWDHSFDWNRPAISEEKAGAFLYLNSRHKAGPYFYAPSDGNYVYWIRPLIYTWADYFTNTHFAFVPKGTFFYEENAYIVMKLSDDLPRRLDVLLKRLRNPWRVF
jgi:hypothetical protein